MKKLWANGHQTLFYAEGNWNAHLETFTELPDQSIVYHVDQDDIFDVHKKIGHKFAISGGIPNFLLAYETPDKVRAFCKKVIDEVARDGGYIMDASAMMICMDSVIELPGLQSVASATGTPRSMV